jgi:hypothetical protein
MQLSPIAACQASRDGLECLREYQNFCQRAEAFVTAASGTRPACNDGVDSMPSPMALTSPRNSIYQMTRQPPRSRITSGCPSHYPMPMVTRFQLRPHEQQVSSREHLLCPSSQRDVTVPMAHVSEARSVLGFFDIESDDIQEKPLFSSFTGLDLSERSVVTDNHAINYLVRNHFDLPSWLVSQVPSAITRSSFSTSTCRECPAR